VIARGAQGPIQRAYSGLLGFLDLKGSEVAPNSMAGFMQPAIDAQPFLLAGIMQQRTFTVSLGIGSRVSTFIDMSPQAVVPQGKAWIIQDLAITGELAAADTCAMIAVAIQRSTATTAMPYGVQYPGGPTPYLTRVVSSFTPPKPFVLLPGHRLGFSVGSLVLSGLTLFSLSANLAEVNA